MIFALPLPLFIHYESVMAVKPSARIFFDLERNHPTIFRGWNCQNVAFCHSRWRFVSALWDSGPPYRNARPQQSCMETRAWL